MSVGEAMPGLTHKPPSAATEIGSVTDGTLSRPQPQTPPAPLNGPDRLADVIRGVRFRDGEPVHDAGDQAAA
jgi:hypothetical protein